MLTGALILAPFPASNEDQTLMVRAGHSIVVPVIWDLRFTPRIIVECVGLRAT